MKRGARMTTIPPGWHLIGDRLVRITDTCQGTGEPDWSPIRREMPLRVVSEANRRDHWRVKAKRAKDQRAYTYAHLPAMLAGLPLPLVVTLTRVAPRKLDSDNLAGAFKAVRDGVADALGKDDGNAGIEWRYAQQKGEYGIIIEISKAEG